MVRKGEIACYNFIMISPAVDKVLQHSEDVVIILAHQHTIPHVYFDAPDI